RKALQQLFFLEEINHNEMSLKEKNRETMQNDFRMNYFNIFKPHVRSPRHSLMEDDFNALVQSYPSDQYVIKSEEFVHYVLGTDVGGVPLGKFVVGTNTLTGRK